MGDDLGIDPAVIDRIQNHTSKLNANMRGPYQLQQLRGPRRDAMLRWGEYVERLVDGKSDAASQFTGQLAHLG
jgi:hypothetical protein